MDDHQTNPDHDQTNPDHYQKHENNDHLRRATTILKWCLEFSLEHLYDEVAEKIMDILCQENDFRFQMLPLESRIRVLISAIRGQFQCPLDRPLVTGFHSPRAQLLVLHGARRNIERLASLVRGHVTGAEQTVATVSSILDTYYPRVAENLETVRRECLARGDDSDQQLLVQLEREEKEQGIPIRQKEQQDVATRQEEKSVPIRQKEQQDVPIRQEEKNVATRQEEKNVPIRQEEKKKQGNQCTIEEKRMRRSMKNKEKNRRKKMNKKMKKMGDQNIGEKRGEEQQQYGDQSAKTRELLTGDAQRVIAETLQNVLSFLQRIDNILAPSVLLRIYNDIQHNRYAVPAGIPVPVEPAEEVLIGASGVDDLSEPDQDNNEKHDKQKYKDEHRDQEDQGNQLDELDNQMEQDGQDNQIYQENHEDTVTARLLRQCSSLSKRQFTRVVEEVDTQVRKFLEKRRKSLLDPESQSPSSRRAKILELRQASEKITQKDPLPSKIADLEKEGWKRKRNNVSQELAESDEVGISIVLLDPEDEREEANSRSKRARRETIAESSKQQSDNDTENNEKGRGEEEENVRAVGRRRTSDYPKKRKRILWSQEETERLRDGIAEFGLGQWKKIATEYEFSRTPTSLRDRARTLGLM